MKRSYVPPGGFGLASGRVLTRSEVTDAVRRYARKYGYYARTVRSMTSLRNAAMKEYATLSP